MGGFRLGSVFGFEIRIDYSWFIIFFLILWTFTMGVFPMAFPGMDAPTYIAMGVVGTFLFFASLLGHELSHSLVARRKGIPVEGITLFIFGGMAHTRMEFEEPGDEFLIAVVGPISSFLIGLFFAAISWVGTWLNWTVAVTGVAAYLAFINVALAVFNLLPGFPLDGGRLFRAAVWKYTGDLTKATRLASSGGKLMGFLLIALGLLQIFTVNVIGGLWLILIGWFVRVAAEASYSQHLLMTSLKGVRVGEAMTPDPQTVPPDITLEEFVDAYVFRGRHQSYPVVEPDEHPVGIITLNQVREVPREEWPRRTVGETMIPADEEILVRPEEDMTDVLEKLGGSRARRLLVTRNGRLEGIITHSDLARWMDRARMMAQR